MDSDYVDTSNNGPFCLDRLHDEQVNNTESGDMDVEKEMVFDDSVSCLGDIINRCDQILSDKIQRSFPSDIATENSDDKSEIVILHDSGVESNCLADAYPTNDEPHATDAETSIAVDSFRETSVENINVSSDIIELNSTSDIAAKTKSTQRDISIVRNVEADALAAEMKLDVDYSASCQVEISVDCDNVSSSDKIQLYTPSDITAMAITYDNSENVILRDRSVVGDCHDNVGETDALGAERNIAVDVSSSCPEEISKCCDKPSSDEIKTSPLDMLAENDGKKSEKAHDSGVVNYACLESEISEVVMQNTSLEDSTCYGRIVESGLLNNIQLHTLSDPAGTRGSGTSLVYNDVAGMLCDTKLQGKHVAITECPDGEIRQEVTPNDSHEGCKNADVLFIKQEGVDPSYSDCGPCGKMKDIPVSKRKQPVTKEKMHNDIPVAKRYHPVTKNKSHNNIPVAKRDQPVTKAKRHNDIPVAKRDQPVTKTKRRKKSERDPSCGKSKDIHIAKRNKPVSKEKRHNKRKAVGKAGNVYDPSRKSDRISEMPRKRKTVGKPGHVSDSQRKSDQISETPRRRKVVGKAGNVSDPPRKSDRISEMPRKRKTVGKAENVSGSRRKSDRVDETRVKTKHIKQNKTENKEEVIETLNSRSDTKVKAEPHSCDFCGYRTKSKFRLKEHQNVHEEKEVFSCSKCDKKCTRKCNLLRHERSHIWTAEKFKCKECGKLCRHSSHLRIHMRTHTGERPFTCEICGDGFMASSTLSDHMQSIHLKIDRSPQICDVCGKSFSRPALLKVHRRTHPSLPEYRPLKCEYCGKSFAQNGNLKEHQIAVHLGVKNFKCTICDKTFALAHHLSGHIKTHTGERNFTCKICGKDFTLAGNLRRHEKIHSGERPHVCTTCGRSFVQAVNLTNHMATHGMDHDWSCTVCGDTFWKQSGLKKHREIHREDSLYSCDICKKSFTRNGNLQTHKTLHHDLK